MVKTSFCIEFSVKKSSRISEKKLKESEKTLHEHIDNKKNLETSDGLAKEIEHEERLIKIWSNNIKKIKTEMRKIQEKGSAALPRAENTAHLD